MRWGCKKLFLFYFAGRGDPATAQGDEGAAPVCESQPPIRGYIRRKKGGGGKGRYFAVRRRFCVKEKEVPPPPPPPPVSDFP